MSISDEVAQNNWNWGYEWAVGEIKDILEKQRFMTFNIDNQYSIRLMITQKEINEFLDTILNWVFRGSIAKARKDDS